MQKPRFVSNEIYHIYNRGVEKRDVFLDEKDFLRFIHDLFEFNDTQPAIPSNIKFSARNPGKKIDSAKLNQCLEVSPLNMGRERELLVTVLAFCLMPNHFHLLLEQKCDGGITKFMQKLGTGYTMYFNKRNERVGNLFQGCFKAVLVEKDAHFIHLPYYVHANPLDLIMPEWRNGELRDAEKALSFLKQYRWSSFPDYIGIKNFPSVTQRSFLLNFFGGHQQHENDMVRWIKNMDKIALEKDITLE